MKDFAIQQVAKKYDWPESLVLSQALVNADDFSQSRSARELADCPL
ncbi:MAG: hypothetical protein K9K21_11075 [Desulfotignum sp.]|nr:hypothetical protein [Desulfotignum sp.]